MSLEVLNKTGRAIHNNPKNDIIVMTCGIVMIRCDVCVE